MLKGTATRATYVVVAVTACLLVPAMLTWACETPVYRYAMYRWQPAPYEVYFLHAAPASDAQRKMQEQLSAMARDKELPANVLAFDVNLAEEDALERVPADVKKAWLEQPDRETPACLVTSPLGIHVFTGPMEDVNLTQLVDSPVRQALGKQLADGKAGVLLMLHGTDPAANEAARQLLSGVAQDIASGKVNLYSAPTNPANGPSNDAKPADETAPSTDTGAPDRAAPADASTEQEVNAADRETSGEPTRGGDGENVAASRLEIGVLEVRRDDPQETWLVRSLLAVEDDLAGFSEPMVFAVYGRARVLPPFIGKGISRQNLMECVEFITGACSCTVKDQNPGVDLLVRYDWDTAAAALAEKVGAEEGNERQFGGDDFFPELIVPRSGANADANANAVTNSAGTSEPSGKAEDPAAPPEVATPPAAESPTEAADKLTATDAGPAGNPEPPPQSAQDSDVAAADDGDSDSSHDNGEMTAEGGGVADATTAARSQSGSARPTPAEAMDGYVSKGGMILLGGGLAVALLVLFVATFVVLRPR